MGVPVVPGGMDLHQHAILRARAYLDCRPVYLDTETTGPDGYSDDVVELCIIDHDESVILNTLVRPCKLIPPSATAVHGITNDMVREAPTWPDVWPRAAAALHERHIGIYSAGFDLQVLRGCTVRAGLPWRRIDTAFCILKLYAAFRDEPKDPHGNPAWHRLVEAGRACGVSVSNLHGALSDARLAREVLQYIAARWPG